jgi:hypothetical protein
VPTKQTTELERAEEDIPDSDADFFEIDLLASTFTWRLDTHEDNRG